MVSQPVQQLGVGEAGLKPKKETWGGPGDVVAKATRELGQGLAGGGVVNGRVPTCLRQHPPPHCRN